jgi:uncharacterized low-complexity protein
VHITAFNVGQQQSRKRQTTADTRKEAAREKRIPGPCGLGPCGPGQSDQAPADLGAAAAAEMAPPHKNERAPTEETQSNMTAEQIEQHLKGKTEAGMRRPRGPEDEQDVPPPKPNR